MAQAKRYHERRVARIAEGDLTDEQLAEIYLAGGGRCKYCGKLVTHAQFSAKYPRGFDHIVPLMRGGEHTATNMAVCCTECNRTKMGSVLGHDRMQRQRGDLSVVTTIRFPREMYERARSDAKNSGVEIATYVRRIVDQYEGPGRK